MIREAFELDPKSPTFLRWKTRPRHHFNSEKGWMCFNTRDAGRVAGTEFTPSKNRFYYQVGLNYEKYNVHRIVYALAYNADPVGKHIDHKDGNGKNNNPDNLRVATPMENGRNRGKNRNSTSGIKGVSWNDQRRKWEARIMVKRRSITLGRFLTSDEAAAAYESAACHYFKEFHQPQNINPQ